MLLCRMMKRNISNDPVLTVPKVSEGVSLLTVSEGVSIPENFNVESNPNAEGDGSIAQNKRTRSGRTSLTPKRCFNAAIVGI